MNKLLALALNGDETAEKQIFQNLFVRFVVLAKRRVWDGEAARDIAQEACMTIVQKYKTETFKISFEAWTYGVLRMKIGNHIQARLVEKDRLLFEQDPGGSIDDPSVNDLKQKLLDCFRSLAVTNSGYARVLNLVHQGYKTDEICFRLGINRNYFYVILNRGRAMLKSCLETERI